MNNLRAALWIETRKALRSRMPLFTTLGFLILPLVGSLLMFIYKDPEFARKAGLITAKANLIGGSADWPSYLNLLAQGTGIGGIVLFGLVASWVFGREFVDGTLKDLLAVPVSRTSLVLAKFIVMTVWSAGMVTLAYLVGLGLGAVVGLPQGSTQVLVNGSLVVAVTAALVIVAITPFALLASLGRGYLLPLSMAMLVVALGNVLVILGWGGLFPWSVPALYAALAGKAQSVEPVSLAIVVLTSLVGIVATDLWWRYADQNR